MDKISKTYKQYFGIAEQAAMTTKTDTTRDVVLSKQDTTNAAKIQAAQNILKVTGGKIHIEEADLDEAELLNHISDYKGGVEYVVMDPTIAQQVQEEIEQFAKRKGIKVIKKSISNTGKVGYFLFRLGEFPAKESQKIQGYISQMPQVKHFRFNVKNQEVKEPVRKETGRREV
jgi:ribosomal protein S6